MNSRKEDTRQGKKRQTAKREEEDEEEELEGVGRRDEKRITRN